jgi:hypothetical protein
MIWTGPIVIVIMEDSIVIYPRLYKDITLEAYRDTIDYLGFYYNRHGSMIDSIRARAAFTKRLLRIILRDSKRVYKYLGYSSV